MNTNDVCQIIDKLSEKFGVAVDQLKPVGDIVMEQYRTRELFMGITNASVFIIAFSVLAYCLYRINKMCKDDTFEPIFIIVGMISLLPCLFSFFDAISSFKHYLAPLPSMLGL